MTPRTHSFQKEIQRDKKQKKEHSQKKQKRLFCFRWARKWGIRRRCVARYSHVSSARRDIFPNKNVMVNTFPNTCCYYDLQRKRAFYLEKLANITDLMWQTRNIFEKNGRRNWIWSIRGQHLQTESIQNNHRQTNSDPHAPIPRLLSKQHPNRSSLAKTGTNCIDVRKTSVELHKIIISDIKV